MNNPWDFNTFSNSPNKASWIEYDEKSLTEFSMGSPLSGCCDVKNGTKKIRLKGLFGGPPIWSEDSKYLALPRWTRDHNQCLVLIELRTLTIKELDQKFRVLHLSDFKDGIIEGIDSPIYQTEKIRVNVADFEEKKRKHWW